MMRDRQETGRIGERMAADALISRGYELVERNWRCARGEIDIVARDGDCWAFVEVKTRRGIRSELPEDGLTPHKAERLVELAEIYLAEHGLENVDWRIDLVAIELNSQNSIKRLHLIPGVGVE